MAVHITYIPFQKTALLLFPFALYAGKESHGFVQLYHNIMELFHPPTNLVIYSQIQNTL